MIVHRKIRAFLVLTFLQCLVMLVGYRSLRNIYPLIWKRLEFSSDVRRQSSIIIYPEELERFDWKGILEPCKLDMAWKNRSFNDNAVLRRTSAKDTILVNYEINPAGYYSKFIFQSRKSDGKVQTTGGDYWRAYLRGMVWQMGFVRDLNNGMYEVWFLITEAGSYELNLLLEYSQCEGLRDPPVGWFERGNIHGRFQEDGILGYIDDFLMGNVTVLQFHVNDSPSTEVNTTMSVNQVSNKNSDARKMREKCGTVASRLTVPCFTPEKYRYKCEFVWSGYGRWKKGNRDYIWLPNFPESKPGDFSKKGKLDTLWFLGDSLTYRLWDSSYTRVLCRQAFKKCSKTYMWVYDVKKYGEHKRPNNVGVSFNSTRFFEPLRSILDMADMKSNRSVIVINFGLHLVMSLSFSEYAHVIDTFAGIIGQYRSQWNRSSTPHFIWKTTTLSHKENTKRWNVTQARFLTNHRITLFNAYANSKLCKFGIPILDIFPISASFPEGTRDHVHYHYNVFEPAEDALANYVWRTYNR